MYAISSIYDVSIRESLLPHNIIPWSNISLHLERIKILQGGPVIALDKKTTG